MTRHTDCSKLKITKHLYAEVNKRKLTLKWLLNSKIFKDYLSLRVYQPSYILMNKENQDPSSRL